MIRRARGFSMIELMISLALFGMIAAGAMSLVLSGARSQQHAARVDIAQSGLRAGIDFISRDLVSLTAGARSGFLYDAQTATNLNWITVTNSSTGPDVLELYLIDATTQANVFTVGVGAGVAVVQVDAAPSFANGDWIQLCDLGTGIRVRVTGLGVLGGFPTLTFVALPVGAPTLASPTYAYRSRHVRYAVDAAKFGASGTANNSALTLDLFDGNNAQPLAEGIEDFQVALGIDRDNDGVIDPELGAAPNDDEWVYNVVGDTAPTLADLQKLKVVRFTLTVASTMQEPGTFAARPKAEDRSAGAADGYFRRTIRTEVTVRNLTL